MMLATAAPERPSRQRGGLVSIDGVFVANAALADVGLPALIQRGSDGRPIWRTTEHHREAHRAALLGLIAELGPDVLTRCVQCAFEADLRRTVPCTPARDVLRGVTCGDSR